MNSYRDTLLELWRLLLQLVYRLPNVQERRVFRYRLGALWRVILGDGIPKDVDTHLTPAEVQKQFERLALEVEATALSGLTARYPWLLDPKHLTMAHLFDLMTEIGANWMEGDCRQITEAHALLREMRTGVITEMLGDCSASDLRLIDPASPLPPRAVEAYHAVRRQLGVTSPIWRLYYRGIGFPDETA